MATVSTTKSLIGCQFEEQDIERILTAIDSVFKDQRAELTERRAAAIKTPKRQRKTLPEIQEILADSQRLRANAIDQDLARLAVKVSASNVWGEEFSVGSLDELWEHVARQDIRKFEASAWSFASGDSARLEFKLELETGSEFNSYFRSSGPVALIRSVRAAVEEVIDRR